MLGNALSLHLAWVNGGWRWNASGIVEAYFPDGYVEIPVGKSRAGAFYLKRIGEAEWQVAPVRYLKHRPESFDGDGKHFGFLYLVGAPEYINDQLEQA